MIASVIWYLVFARHTPQHLRQRSDSHLEILDDTRECSDLSSDNSEEEPQSFKNKCRCMINLY